MPLSYRPRLFLMLSLAWVMAGMSLDAQFGETEQLFPHIAIGGGATTFFDIHNPGEQEITVAVDLFDTEGSLLEGSSRPVPAGGSVSLSFGGLEGTAQAGWARVSSAGRFAASEFFQIRDTLDQLLAEVGVLSATPATQIQFFGAFQPQQATRTGFAVANPSETRSSEMTVRLIDRDGSERATQAVTLGPGEQLARFLEEEPYFEGLEDFEGGVEIRADEPVIAVTLRSDGDLLATVSVIEPGLPIRGEFPEGGTPNLIAGHEANTVVEGAEGATIGGGGTEEAVSTQTEQGGTLTLGCEPPNLNQVTGNYGSVAGGAGNEAGFADTVGGGTCNTASGTASTVGGGLRNTASSFSSTVGGGGNNLASGGDATVGGGTSNDASGAAATVGGGEGNMASTLNSTVGGGFENTASGDYSTVTGGSNNTASGDYSTVPGGDLNEALGAYSFAGGRRAKACGGCFVWADSTDADFDTGFFPNRFYVRASGGVHLFSNGALSTGVILGTGSGSWMSLSDQESKENFQVIDPRQVLEGLSRVPITTWNYKAQGSDVRHIGPVAQDFYAAFGVGPDERYISTVDADGVALAAIQGLYGMVQERDDELEHLRAELAEIKRLMRQE